MKVEGVKRAHSLYVWSLTLNRTALSAHLVLGTYYNYTDVLSVTSLSVTCMHAICMETNEDSLWIT
jgi:Co/Zn/Cd efflux system component